MPRPTRSTGARLVSEIREVPPASPQRALQQHEEGQEGEGDTPSSVVSRSFGAPKTGEVQEHERDERQYIDSTDRRPASEGSPLEDLHRRIEGDGEEQARWR
jgi:hypothetical protein